MPESSRTIVLPGADSRRLSSALRFVLLGGVMSLFADMTVRRVPEASPAPISARWAPAHRHGSGGGRRRAARYACASSGMCGSSACD